MSTLTAPTAPQTLKNLLTAFSNESNASARYAAWAKKADEEGYLKIGSLFRAIARSEHIHAANHMAVIHKMRGRPDADLQPIEVKSTVENLQEAIAGELWEINVMYPDFILQAEAQNNSKARRTFKYAIESEKDHSVLFTKALDHVRECVDQECQRLEHPAMYYVCPECGFTATKTVLDHCPVCTHERDEFEVIN